jgi:hypothetical protein
MRFAFEIRRQSWHTIFCSLTLTVYATHKLLSRQTFEDIKSHLACHVQNVPRSAALACIGSLVVAMTFAVFPPLSRISGFSDMTRSAFHSSGLINPL